ncbi:MAG: hypothetical protein RLZZ367_477 [Bacteroidota bacterium]|jgi:hypothetical protein
MKKLLVITAILFCIQLGSKAQILIDSAKIVQLGDTLYGVALYGVYMPTPPCAIIDSSKQVTGDTINIRLCYLYGDAQSSGCKAYDTITLGNLQNSNYTVVVALSRADTTTSTCANPNRKDTIVLQYIRTGIINVESDYALQLFPNPAGNTLSGKVAGYTGNTILQVTSATGQLLLQNTTTQPNFAIDISALPPGLYFLQLTNGSQRVVKRFVKQ